MFTFSLGDLEQNDPQQVQEYPYRSWEDVYRDKWQWDKVAWGTHCVDCYPGQCPYRVYVKEGIVWLEEQSATLPVIEEGVPDFNPMGCQKGSSWSQQLYGKDRVLYPLKRVGERGEGKWKRISWDEALTEIADAIIDAIQEQGPESILRETSPEIGSGGLGTYGKFLNLLGGVFTDVNGVINDFSTGLYITFGKFNPVSTADDWFHADLLLIWHMNPIYTRIPYYHYIAEARYKGAEVVTIAPDFSPSAVHADYHIPVRLGSDAALALAMSKVIIDEGIYNAGFVKEQTDLPILVRLDNRRFLRASDIAEGGGEEQFYFYDSKSQRVVEAPRAKLSLDGVDPALEGTFTVTLKDGRQVEVTPVFELLKERLNDYTPEKAEPMCGVNPEVIRTLARKVATKKAHLIMGWNPCKYYHGDLMERSMSLVLGLTGNWGRKGTGPKSWSAGMFDGSTIYTAKRRPGREGALEVLQARANMIERLKQEDPTMTEEMAAIELARRTSTMVGLGAGMVPPAFWWYWHGGFRENWNNRQWSDPGMPREFDDYFKEAMDKGWWTGLARPGPNLEPRVLIELGGNILRRTRGGQQMLLKHFWPKLKMIVTIDWRMTTTGLHSDIFLPAANHYEKINYHIPTHHVLNLTFCDRAAEPPGEAKGEWEIFRLLAKKVEERAKARNFLEFKDAAGNTRRLDNLYDSLTLGGEFEDEEKLFDEMVRDTVTAGTLPEGTTLETLREKGFVRFLKLGISPMSIAQASDIEPNETFNPFRNHTEKKEPYPTLTRRAEFYIDHEWFLEAGEELPCHKEPPKMGGDYPFAITSGHNRWSIHSMNMTNWVILQTHRGHPFVFMNPDDAARLGIRDDEEVRLHNDVGSLQVAVKLSPAVRPGQLILYNGWEPYMFRNWFGQGDVEPGMVKWLHFAGGYGHLRYWPIQWQPVQVDRAVRVDVSKID